MAPYYRDIGMLDVIQHDTVRGWNGFVVNILLGPCGDWKLEAGNVDEPHDTTT